MQEAGRDGPRSHTDSKIEGATRELEKRILSLKEIIGSMSFRLMFVGDYKTKRIIYRIEAIKGSEPEAAAPSPARKEKRLQNNEKVDRIKGEIDRGRDAIYEVAAIGVEYGYEFGYMGRPKRSLKSRDMTVEGLMDEATTFEEETYEMIVAIGTMKDVEIALVEKEMSRIANLREEKGGRSAESDYERAICLLNKVEEVIHISNKIKDVIVEWDS